MGKREMKTFLRLLHTCSFMTRTFWPAYLLYSSKIALKHHFCSFLKQPMTVPVRCRPRLHMTKTGYVEGWTNRCKACKTISSVIGSHAFVLYKTPRWCSLILRERQKSKLNPMQQKQVLNYQNEKYLEKRPRHELTRHRRVLRVQAKWCCWDLVFPERANWEDPALQSDINSPRRDRNWVAAPA